MDRKYLWATLTVLLLAAASAAALKLVVRKPQVRFSESDSFQQEAFELTLSGGLFGKTIYYTLDGNNPTKASKVYDGPIQIASGSPVKATVVKAAVCIGGQMGEVCTRTYFVGEDIKDLFDVMVVSLSADEDDLYDEETGILANYKEAGENGEWNRPAYVEFYGPDGSLMLKQGTGIAVSGHGSREYAQKSFKLIGSVEYDREHPTFDYDFFDADMAGNRTGQSYNRLVLRNGGSDHEGTMLKWNVVSRLAKEAGILCAGARPGILFLNGEYYGIIQLQEKYTAYNIASAIGVQKGDIEKYEPNEINSARFGGYYGRLHTDLDDPERQEKLEACVDMPDMLRHYAVNLIMNNTDWPFHNFLSWKCAATGSSAYSDGRVRFFLYDLDAVYQDTRGQEIENTFDYLMEEPVEDMTDTLSLLMHSVKYRTQFVNLACDLAGTVYDGNHVVQVIEEEDQKLARSMELFYTKRRRERQQRAVREMKAAARKSCAELYEGLEKHLGAVGAYRLRVEAPEGVDIVFSQIRVPGGEQYAGIYYHNYPLTLKALPQEGQRVRGFRVNGTEIEGEELLLDQSFQGKELKIELMTE